MQTAGTPPALAWPAGDNSPSHCPPAARLTPLRCLALAHSYGLPAAATLWQAEVLASAGALTAGWQQPGCPSRAAAEQQLVELPHPILVKLAVDVLAQAGCQAVEIGQLRLQAPLGERQGRTLHALCRAVDEHVRSFPGARDVCRWACLQRAGKPVWARAASERVIQVVRMTPYQS